MQNLWDHISISKAFDDMSPNCKLMTGEYDIAVTIMKLKWESNLGYLQVK